MAWNMYTIHSVTYKLYIAVMYTVVIQTSFNFKDILIISKNKNKMKWEAKR